MESLKWLHRHFIAVSVNIYGPQFHGQILILAKEAFRFFRIFFFGGGGVGGGGDKHIC